MHFRVKELRELLKLSQQVFSNRIDMSRSNLANIENGTVSLTPRVKKAIIREFRVNETWLDTGKGEIFIKSQQSLIDELAAIYSLDDIDIKTIENFLLLSSKKRKQVLGYIDRLLNE